VDKKPNILIIDDDAQLRQTLSDILKAKGCAPIAVAQAKAAVEGANKKKPAVAIIDLKLEDVSGLDVMREIKDRSPDTECIVLTGYPSQESAMEAINLGAYGYIQKPYDVEQLLVTVRRAIEKRAAEQALRESEERYRDLVENANDIIYTHDLEGNLTSANAAATRVYGYTTEEMLQLDIADVIDPEYLPLAQQKIEDKLEDSSQTEPYELLTHTREGEPIWVEVSTRLVERDGQPVGVQAIARNITDRTRTEEALKKSTHDLGERVKELSCLYAISSIVAKPGVSLEEVLQGVVDLIPSAWQYPEITRARLALNDREFRTQGFQNTPWKQMSSIFVHEQRVGALEVCYLEEKPQGHDGPFLREDTLLLNSIAARVGYIVERKQAQAALQRMMAFNESIIENMGEGLVVTDAQGYIIFTNPTFDALLGYEAEELIGQRWPLIVPPDQQPTVEAAVERRVRGESDRYELDLVRKHGTRAPVLVSGSPRLEEGRYAGTLAVLTDISERKRAEDETKRHSQELAALYDTALDISRQLDLEPLLHTIVERASGLLEGYAGAMYFHREEHDDLELLVSDNLEPDLTGSVLKRGEGLSGKVLESEQPMVVDNYRSWEGRAPIYEELSADAVLAVPVKWGDRVLGVINVLRKKGATFDEEDIRLLSLLANQAAVAIENAQLYTEIQTIKEYYRSVIESIPSSLLTIDQKLKVVSANQNFLQKARRSESETIGRRIEDVFAPAVLASSKLEERITKVFKTGKPFAGGEMERLPRLPGRVYFYRLSALKDEKGAVKNVVLLMDDVTEQKRLGEEVRRTERHLVSVVDSANDLMASMDTEARILTWNKAAERISGFEFGEVKGQHLRGLCVKDDQQQMGAWLVRLAKGQFTKQNMEINLRTKGGTEVPISWACSRMQDDQRRIVGFVAVGRDLTERQRLEAQLIKSAKLASLGVMAGGIAHEIRNPLAISSAAAQLLVETPGDEKLQKEAAMKIHSGIERASYIIENLLRFARPPQERMAPMDIRTALKETLSLFANQIRVQRIELSKDFAPALPLVVGNKNLLQQVFSNMILNACNAMPDGGNLTITTRVDSGNQVEIEFADTGRGIPKENLSKVFDPFFTTMPVGKGTGLGLSISYNIIRQHQGTIDVESKVEGGTFFTVRLPVATHEKGDAGG